MVEIRRESPRDRAAEAFWATDANPGYDFTLLDVLDAPGNFWDRRSWWQKVLVVCGLILLSWLVAAVVFHK